MAAVRNVSWSRSDRPAWSLQVPKTQQGLRAASCGCHYEVEFPFKYRLWGGEIPACDCSNQRAAPGCRQPFDWNVSEEASDGERFISWCFPPAWQASSSTVKTFISASENQKLWSTATTNTIKSWYIDSCVCFYFLWRYDKHSCLVFIFIFSALLTPFA